MLFTILGNSYNIDKDRILQAVDGKTPELFDGRHRYFARIKGRRYPIKQLLAGATGMSNTEFTAQYAHRILTKLGFEVEELGPPPPRPHFIGQPKKTRHVEEARAVPPQKWDGLQPDDGSRDRTDTPKFAVAVDQDEDGFVFASCPALPGCHSQGRTRQEALRNVAEAIRGYIASMKKHGEEVPNVDWEVVEVPL